MSAFRRNGNGATRTFVVDSTSRSSLAETLDVHQVSHSLVLTAVLASAASSRLRAPGSGLRAQGSGLREGPESQPTDEELKARAILLASESTKEYDMNLRSGLRPRCSRWCPASASSACGDGCEAGCRLAAVPRHPRHRRRRGLRAADRMERRHGIRRRLEGGGPRPRSVQPHRLGRPRLRHDRRSAARRTPGSRSASTATSDRCSTTPSTSGGSTASTRRPAR